ncbi:hypothetical protein KFL_003970050 [Klebsormidium nitens]|uniref:Uncharacterized protein n=1 Tax=Klebsormidium nitens TaxID=105231 RepID=A0A1Y1IIQ6_KLENI|nr:hypothetical protein KFL_003970050 [Klebsormidium nitens]|eukprot:GAQ88058.1 hypothetical protein KFL_003970050 [Klebsormidium nitens]
MEKFDECRRELAVYGALFFSTATFLKHPSQSQAGSIVVSSVPSPQALELLDQASEAWGRGLDPTSQNRWAALAEACTLFDKLVALEPERTEWREARGQLRVDSKKFNEALDDFNYVLEKNPSNFRGYSSRALAYEGLSYWDKAVDDYTTALRLGKKATGFDEPYVLNSRGNAFASLGQWSEALRDYELSVKGFQEGRQLDGAIYSAANAALMQIQLGNEKEGLKELTTVARRAPGSIDMRAALAALYWSQGREREAESTWQFACENINAGQLYDGCAKYRDQDWLRRIRRWPPVMADKMQDFFQLRHKT